MHLELEDIDGFIGIWSHKEANDLQVNQLVSSGCGATAIMTALKIMFSKNTCFSVEEVLEKCILRKRANTSPLPEYLLSRSIAGCTGEEISKSLKKFHENIYSQFFKSSNDSQTEKCLVYHSLTIPNIENDFLIENTKDLILWISNKIQNGYGLIATLNLQLTGNDAWHHQFIYGVHINKRLIYCTNPLSVYLESEFKMFLSTPSILVIRKEDIVSRYHIHNGDDSIYNQDIWRNYHINHQIQNCINNDKNHIIIPASYAGGITVFKLTS